MNAIYTEVIQYDNSRRIGWVEEIPGVNSQGRTRQELLEDLRLVLKDVL